MRMVILVLQAKHWWSSRVVQYNRYI